MTTVQSCRHGIQVTLLACCTLLVYGCSSLGGISSSGSQQIRLVSDPAGATAFADGNEIGITPFTFTPGDAFRSGFASSDSAIVGYRYVGKLSVKKPGCRDYLTEVDDNLLSKDIHVQLECDPDYQPVAQPVAAPATAAPATRTAPQAAPATADNPEQRLLQIEKLHDKGLLSDEEYRQLRQRVLDTL